MVELPVIRRRPPVRPILLPFERRAASRSWPLYRLLLAALFSLGCVVYGVFFSLIGAFSLYLVLLPLVPLVGLLIWMLPAARRVPLRTLDTLFFIYLVGLIVWPNYMAIAIKGLPWITMARLTGVPLALVFLICVSSSQAFRAGLARAISKSRLIVGLVVAMAVIQLVSVFLSRNIGSSSDKFISMQLSCTLVFFAAIHVFSRRETMELWVRLAWVSGLVVAGLGLWEYRLQHVPWAGHIPGFLKIDSPLIDGIVQGSSRYSTHQYRVQSVYSTSLALSEFMALLAPFVIHEFLNSRIALTKLAAAASFIFFLFVTLLTDARLGVVGFVVTALLYGFYWGLLKWRQHPRGLVGPAIVLGYPAVFLIAVSATFLVHRIRVRVWGGGAQAASTDARITQFRMGLPMILQNPIGHGLGQGAATLGFAPFGFLTIDSYYLTVALECGVLGFVAFFGAIACAIIQGVRSESLRLGPATIGTLAVPAAISLTSFIIIKSVFSQTDNLPIIYMVLGLLVALRSQLYESARSLI